MPSLSGSSSALVCWPSPKLPKSEKRRSKSGYRHKVSVKHTMVSNTRFFREHHPLMAVLLTCYHDDFEMAGLSIVMMWYVVDDDFSWWVKESGMSSRDSNFASLAR